MLRGRSMLVRKTDVLPVECVVRGYLIGSGWKEYQSHGHRLRHPAARRATGMADRLDEPIFTPATKAETGHDENISFDAVGEDRRRRTRAASSATRRLALYDARPREYALARAASSSPTRSSSSGSRSAAS